MQLALALSSSITEAGLPNEQRGERRERAQAAPEQAAASSCQDADDDQEEEGPCFGSCLGLETDFAGEPSDRPDPSQPDGGWGFTPCCGNRAHFDCLGRWLRPDDAELGSLVESTSGPVSMELTCLFCKHTLSRSFRRMLTDCI